MLRLHEQAHTVQLHCLWMPGTTGTQGKEGAGQLMAEACSRSTGCLCMLRHEDLAWRPGATALGWPCCLDAMCQGDCSAAPRGALSRASTDCFSMFPAHDPTCSASSTAIVSSWLMAPLLPFCAALASSWRNSFSRFHIAGRPNDGRALQPPCLASLQVAPGSFILLSHCQHSLRDL